MTILYRKHYRLIDLSDKDSAKKVFPTITYEYGKAATLTEADTQAGNVIGGKILRFFRSLAFAAR